MANKKNITKNGNINDITYAPLIQILRGYSLTHAIMEKLHNFMDYGSHKFTIHQYFSMGYVHVDIIADAPMDEKTLALYLSKYNCHMVWDNRKTIGIAGSGGKESDRYISQQQDRGENKSIAMNIYTYNGDKAFNAEVNFSNSADNHTWNYTETTPLSKEKIIMFKYTRLEPIAISEFIEVAQEFVQEFPQGYVLNIDDEINNHKKTINSHDFSFCRHIFNDDELWNKFPKEEVVKMEDENGFYQCKWVKLTLNDKPHYFKCMGVVLKDDNKEHLEISNEIKETTNFNGNQLPHLRNNRMTYPQSTNGGVWIMRGNVMINHGLSLRHQLDWNPNRGGIGNLKVIISLDDNEVANAFGVSCDKLNEIPPISRNKLLNPNSIGCNADGTRKRDFIAKDFDNSVFANIYLLATASYSTYHTKLEHKTQIPNTTKKSEKEVKTKLEVVNTLPTNPSINSKYALDGKSVVDSVLDILSTKYNVNITTEMIVDCYQVVNCNVNVMSN